MTETDEKIIDYSGTTELEASNQASGEKFILFEAGGRVCGVPAASVLEVVHSLAVTIIPNSPPWLLGLSVFRGEPIALIHPATIVSGVTKSVTERCFKTIIFRARGEEAQLALPVDRINEMITHPDSTEHHSDGSALTGLLRNGTQVLLLEPYRFIEEIREGGR